MVSHKMDLDKMECDNLEREEEDMGFGLFGDNEPQERGLVEKASQEKPIQFSVLAKVNMNLI